MAGIRQGCRQGMKAEGGWGRSARDGSVPCWGRSMHGSWLGSPVGGNPCRQRVLPLQAAACSLLGAAVPSGRTPACRCRGWHCRSCRRAASPYQEHADLPGVSLQQAPRSSACCFLCRWRAWHWRWGQDQPLEHQTDQAGGGGTCWHLVGPGSAPHTLGNAVSCNLSLPGNTTTHGAVYHTVPRCYSERLCGHPGWQQLGGTGSRGALCMGRRPGVAGGPAMLG